MSDRKKHEFKSKVLWIIAGVVTAALIGYQVHEDSKFNPPPTPITDRLREQDTLRCQERVKSSGYFNTTLAPFIRANMPGARNLKFTGTVLKGDLAVMGFTVYEPTTEVTLQFEAEARMNFVNCRPDDVQIYQLY